MTNSNLQQQISLQDILPKFHQNGMIKVYAQYQTEIENIAAKFFHNPQGIHGVAHAKRVLFLCLLLSYYNDLDQKDRQLLILAAVYHDIGRTNDWKCEVHGYRSVEKLEQIGFGAHLTEEEKKIVYFIIENHCINDKTALKNLAQAHIKDTDKTEQLFYIFKDSDALDRCRINDLDITYLRNKHSFQLPDLAWELLRLDNHQALLEE